MEASMASTIRREVRGFLLTDIDKIYARDAYPLAADPGTA